MAGLSEEEAKKKASSDWWMELLQSAAGGFIGGVFMGGAKTTVETGIAAGYGVANSINDAKYHHRVYGNDVSALIDEALAIDPENKLALKLKKDVENGKKISGANIAKLVGQNEAGIVKGDTSAIKAAAAQRLTELGETGDVDAISDALSKHAAGEQLTARENWVVRNSKYGAQVGSELKSGADWAQKIGTERINADEYSRLVKAAQIEQTADSVTEDNSITNSTIEPQDTKTEATAATIKGSLQVADEVAQPDNANTRAPVNVLADNVVDIDEDQPEKSSITLENASKAYGAQAGAYIATYNLSSGQDIAKFDDAYRKAYEWGQSDAVPLDVAMTSSLTSYLTEAQREAAYLAGADAKNELTNKRVGAVNRRRNGKTGRRKGTVQGKGVSIADLKKTFNDKQGKAYKILVQIAEVTGIDIVLYRSEANADGEFTEDQGQFKWSDDKIYIDINAGLESIKDVNDLAKYTMLRTFGHEFVHFLEKHNPAEYNELRKAVFDALRVRGEDVDTLILDKQKLGGKNQDGSYKLSYEAASREVVAEGLADILPDSHFAEQLAEKHKNIFETLLEKLKEFVESIREYFESINPTMDKGAQALMDEVDGTVRYMESIVALFDKVAVNAVENYQASVAVDESVDTGKNDANAQKTHEKRTESHENASMQTADTTLDKRAISYFKSRANVYVIEFDGQKYLSDSAVMIQVTDTDIQYANEEFDVAENSLPDSNKAILNSAGTLLVAPPTEVRIATNKTFYRFDVGDQKLYFNKKLLSLLDGGLLYYGIIGENAGVIKSVNTDGSVKGYLLGMKMPKVLQSTEEAPAKLRSFSKKMQALIQSKSATDNNNSNITQAQTRPHSDEIGDENNGSTDTELLEGRKVSTADRSGNGLREQGANSEKLAGYLGVLGTDEGQVSSEHRAGESGWLVRQKNSQSSEGRHTASILRAVSRISLSGRDTVGRIVGSEISQKFKDTVFKDENGNLLSLYHWTTATFDQFAKGEFGFHFGTLESAHDRYKQTKDERPNTAIGNYKEVYVNITNPIELRDDGSWDAGWVAYQLVEKEIISEQQYDRFSITEGFYDNTYDNPAAEVVRDILTQNKYDGIVYKNESEDAGSYSVIALYPDQIITVAENGILKDGNGITEPPSDEDIVQTQSRKHLNSPENSKHKKYSYEWFANKPDMTVTIIDDTTTYRGKNMHKQIADDAILNAQRVGSTNENGNAVIHVRDNGADVIVSKNGIRHSLDRRIEINAPVAINAGEILQNSIQINNLNPRSENIKDTYVLLGMAKNKKNEPYVVSFVVNRYTNELVDMDVMYSVNAKTEPAGSLSPSITAQSTGYFTGSTISIARFLDFVNQYFPDVMPEDILKHYGHNSRPDGVLGQDALYQPRTKTLSDHEVLEMAADEVLINDFTDAEKDAFNIFKKRLARLRQLQEERAEQGSIYKEQQFGAKPNREEAAKTLNRMHILDDQIKQANDDLFTIEEKAVLRSVLKKARRVVEQDERAKSDEKLKRWRDRRNNATAIKKYRERIKTDVDTLTNWILHPNNKDIVQHVPDVLKNSVIPFLSSIDFTSKRQLKGGEATKADQQFMKQLKSIKSALKQNIDTYGLYSGYTDLPEDFMDNLQRFIDTTQALVEKNSGEFVINNMTAEELNELSKVVRTLKKYITQFNRFHYNSMYQYVYEAGDNSIQFMDELDDAGSMTGGLSNFVFWQQIRPAYAFERFGRGGKAIYDGFRRAHATLAFNTKVIEKFANDTYTAKEVKAWEKEIKQIELGEDIVKVPVAMLMSFYELSKQPDSLAHILGEGVRVATYTRKGQKISDKGHTLTQGDVTSMVAALTDRQKEVADALQKFMAETGGKWGNHVSMKRWGEELFGNPQYFPINSDGRHLQATADENPSAASLYALLNMSFTKERKEGANNRIILYSIFDVFANHMASMAQYNAFALPMLDALKWFNYQQKSMPDENGRREVLASVRDQMARVYGTPDETRPGSGKKGYAENFVINILKAYNGTEAQGSPNDTFMLKMLHRFNVAQVSANLRVLIQQPTAIMRAGEIIDYRSILKGMKLNPKAIKKNIEEMHQYSGIAVWKSLGFYDINISRGLTEIIKHKTGFVDKVNEIGMKGAETADLLTWAGIWSACKEETIKKKRLKPTDSGFFEAVTELFEDVIYKTQVVDSVLTKNEYLRDKGYVSRLFGSFMGEPTAAISSVIHAVDNINIDRKRGMTRAQAWKKNGRAFVRMAYVYVLSNAFVAAVQAIGDAWRDDDEYETFLEKWLEAFGGNFIDELNPIGKLPIFSEFVDVFKEILAAFGVDTYGNTQETTFGALSNYVVKLAEIIADRVNGEDGYTWYAAVYKGLQLVSGATGLPMASATREIVSAWNNIVGSMVPSLKVKTYDSGDKNEIKYAYMDGYLTDKEAIDLLIEKGLVDSDHEAYWLVEGWEAGEGYSRYDAVLDAVRNGGDVNAAIAAMTAHGYTEKQIIAHVKSEIGDWYKEGDISKQQATEMLTKYGDMDSDEITALVNKWSSKVVTGIDYEDIKDEYLAGNITAARAIEMRVRYGGETKEKATEAVSKWRSEKETGIDYENLKEVFTDGEITEANARAMLVEYGGKTEEQALLTVRYWAFKRDYPNVYADDAWIDEYYEEVQSSGMSINVFVDYRNQAKGITGEDKKVRRMAIINSMPITNAQKDALYYAEGWAASKIYEAPWH